MSWTKRTWKSATGAAAAYGFFTSELFKLYLLPAASTGVFVVLALIDKYDAATLYLGALVAFAATAHGLLRYSEWRQRMRVENKLIFAGPHFGIDKTADGNALSVVQIGAALRNTASFPISYKVTKIRTSADATLPSKGTILNYDETVQPESPTLFRDRPIDLKQPTKALPATLEIDLLYGHPGREKYPLSRSINIELRYDPDTGQLHPVWIDAPRTKP